MSLCSLYAQKLRYCHVNVILALRLAKNLTAAPPTCHRRPLFARFTPVSSPTCPSCLWTNHHKNSCSHTYLDFFYAFCSLSALSLSMEKHNRCNIWGTSFGQNFINTDCLYRTLSGFSARFCSQMRPETTRVWPWETAPRIRPLWWYWRFWLFSWQVGKPGTARAFQGYV